MKHMLKFKMYESVYSFNKVINKELNKIEYVFKNRDGIEFRVFFRHHNSFGKDIVWVREYVVKNARGVMSAFQEVNTNDAFNILKTVTEITNQFLREYQPKEVIIEHVETRQEMEDRMKTGERLSNDTVTKRAIINSRFLKRDLLPNYSYELNGYTSTLKRID